MGVSLEIDNNKKYCFGYFGYCYGRGRSKEEV